jgi:hypothetical protein
MSCRIPYEKLQKLFDKSLQFDRETYRFYRNSIISIMNLRGVDEEAKVHAIWFMGLSYNNALKLEDDIVTEGLPAKISDLVYDKLTDPNADYKVLLQSIDDILSNKEITTASLEGPVAESPTEITPPPAEPSPVSEKTLKRIESLKAVIASYKDDIIPGYEQERKGLVSRKNLATNPALVEKLEKDIAEYDETIKSAKQTLEDAEKQLAKLESPRPVVSDETPTTSTPLQLPTTLKPEFRGKLIYATPGAGKSTFVKSNPGVVDSDQLMIAEMQRRHPEFKKNPGETDGDFIYRYVVEHDHKGEINEIVLNEIRQLTSKGFTVLTGTKAYIKDSDVVVRVSPKSDRIISRFGTLEKAEGFSIGEEKSAVEAGKAPMKLEKNNLEDLLTGKIAPTPSEKTPLQKINDILVKLNSSDKSNQVLSLLNEVQRILNQSRDFSNKQKIQILDNFAKALSSKKDTSVKATALAIIETEKENLSDTTLSTEFIDISSIDNIGKNVFLIRQESGNLIEALFINDKYYVVPEDFDGTNLELLEEYVVKPNDYVRPYYETTENLHVVNNYGDLLRLNTNLKSSGLDFDNVRIYPEGVAKDAKLDNKPGHQRIADNLKPGTGLQSQIRLIADRRRSAINKRRVERLRALGYNINFENQLRRNQINFLALNPRQPIVTFLNSKSSVDLILSDSEGINWDYIRGIDDLGFVYPNGETRYIDWDSQADLDILKVSLRLFQWKPYSKEQKAQTYEYVAPNDTELHNLKLAVQRIKNLKNTILDLMSENEEAIEVPTDLYKQYIDIANVFMKYDFTSTKPEDNLSNLKSKLESTSSVITTRVAKVLYGQIIPSTIRTENVVGVIKKTPNGIRFESSIETGYQPIDDFDNPITFQELFEREGVNINSLTQNANSPNLSTYNYFYLVRMANKWHTHPMVKINYITDETQVVDFLSVLFSAMQYRPEFLGDNAADISEFIQTFNNSGWGFNALAESGLLANVEFLKMVGGEPMFGITFRATEEYPLNQEFNDKKLRVSFSFNFADISKNLDTLYRELGIKPGEFKSVEDRITLGAMLAEKIKKNKESLSLEANQAIQNLNDLFRGSVNNINSQLNSILDRHGIEVGAGKNPYIADPTQFRNTIFGTNTSEEFKLRTKAESINPLVSYSVFGVKNANNMLKLSVARPAVITGDTLANSKPAPVGVRPSAETEVTEEVKPKIKKRTFSIVSALKGLQKVSDERIAAEIEDVKRFLGSTVEHKSEDMTNEDVNGFALGYYENRVITLNSALKVAGVVYHEAFHAVFRLSLTQEERAKYLALVRSMVGEPKQTADGRIYIRMRGENVYFDQFRKDRRYSGIDDAQIADYIYEEYLAEGFREYKLNKVEPKNKLLQRLYEGLSKLIDFFRGKSYRTAKESIDQLYRSIDNGKYHNVIGDEMVAPRAYELTFIPTSIDAEGDVIGKQVDSYTTDQLVDRITREMLKRSYDIQKGSPESFQAVFNEVTEELIYYFRASNFVKDDSSNSKRFIEKYEPMFRAMRFMMGAAHRENILENFMLENNSSNPRYDNYDLNKVEPNHETSIEAYNKTLKEVKDRFESVSLVKEDTSSEEDDYDRESSPESENSDTIELQSEETVGDRQYDDEGILTYKPYDGSKEFQKLIKYIKYEFEDAETGIKFDKMVNSKNVINIIRKITVNVPKEDIISHLVDHIEYLRLHIDRFEKSKLENELGRIPQDMSKMIDKYNSLKAVYDTLNEQAQLDENFKPTRAVGEGFFNMFHNVFFYAQKEVLAVSIDTNFEEVTREVKESSELSPIKNQYSVDNLIQKNDVNVVLNNLSVAARRTLNVIYQDELDKLIDELNLYNFNVPTTVTELNNAIAYIYRLTSLGQLNIPVNVIEFSVAAVVKKQFKRLSTKDPNYRKQSALLSKVEKIIGTDQKFVESNSYLDMPKFLKAYLGVLNSIGKPDSVKDSTIRTLTNEYRNIAIFHSKYEPGLSGTMVLNQDNKPISQFVPYVPSIQIISQLQQKGFEKGLNYIYPLLNNWFRNNPWLSTAINPTPITGEKTKEAIENDSIKMFLELMDISIAGGLYQEYNGVYNKSTFKGLGEKGYMLSLLGMFANRRTVTGNYGQTITLFDRAITQLEATSTQFNVTGLYYDYNSNDQLIIDNFKKLVKQEFEEIWNEWSSRDDVKIRHEGYNVITSYDGSTDTVNPKLRAYNFNYLKDFFEVEENEYSDPVKVSTRQKLKEALITAATNNLSFEEAIAQKFYDETGVDTGKTVNDVLSDELYNYGEDAVDDFYDYLNSLDIGFDDLPLNVFVDRKRQKLTGYTRVEDEKKGTSYIREEKGTKERKEAFLRDFLYNTWFNSLFVNQVFDGNIAVGIKNFVQYFKRQKSGVAAGNNNRNVTIDERDDMLTVSFFKQFNGYLNTSNLSAPMTTSPSEQSEEFPIADGQAWSAITRRIKNYLKDGILVKGSQLEKIIKKVRYTTLTAAEIKLLRDNDIVLNSDKPVVADPTYYLKDSEHYINRTDVSYVTGDPEVIGKLYDELDGINFNNYSLEEGETPIEKYERIIQEIHSYFKPKKGREFLHIMLNSLEFHRTDVTFDENVSKRGTVSPIVVNLPLLEQGITEGHPLMGGEVPSVENGYINLSYNKIGIPSSFVYEQVKTGNIKGTNTDAIQKKLLLPSQLDPKEFKEVGQMADKQNQIINARMQFLKRRFKVNDVATVVTKAIQAGLIKQGAGTNILKYYELQDGKNKFNMNLPILGKTPLFYFFSIFNNNLFGPKVAGKKFFHVSGAGYKVVVDDNDNVVSRTDLDANPELYEGYRTRYPTVKEEYDKNGKLTRIVIEVIIPRELASSPQEVEFFEKLYSEFLGSRIPTEAHRSLVSAKVVDYIDATYGNSIIVPIQVHKWAGSDLDIDSLYADVQDYYRTVRGELLKYGDYDLYRAKYGLTLSEAKFVEYLHFMAEDPAFQDLIEADIKKQSANMGYRRLSLQNIAGNFGPHIKAIWDFDENLIQGDMMQVSNTLSLMEKLVSVVNVLTEYGLPSTKEELYEFSVKEGTPVTPVLQNEILDLKIKLLSNPKVYERFIKNANSAQYINQYLSDREIVSQVTKFKNIDKANPFLPQTIGRIRAINNGSQDSVGANANQNKAAALLSSSKVKLTDPYTFKFKYNGKKIDTKNPLENAVELVGGAISMSVDDPSHQALGPLNISRINSSLINALYIYGYPPQFARLINSVDIFSNLINKFNIQNDPSYSRTGFFKIGFSTFLNNELGYLITENFTRLQELGLLQPSETSKKSDFEIDHSKTTISFKDIQSGTVLRSDKPSDFNISVSVKKGRKEEILPDDLAGIVLLSFYNKMLAVGNATSFKISTVTNVYKQIRPSFDSLTKIKDAVKFIKNNEMFENATDILKDNPSLSTLAEVAIPDMIDKSKQLLLDETNLFKAITGLFAQDRSVSQEVVISELKSVLALTTLGKYAEDVVSKMDKTNPTVEETFLKLLTDAMTSEYWLNNTIENDLLYLQELFPNNEFLNSLVLKPATYKGEGSVEVLSSIAGDKVSPELQERLINDFYQLVYDNDNDIHEKAIKLAVHGIVRDGAMSRTGGYLKVIAPDLFKYISGRLDLIQSKLYSIDNSSADNLEKYLRGLDEMFSEIYYMDKSKGIGETSQKALESVLTKLVSVVTRNATSSPSIRMSFYKPVGKDKGKFSPGKFSDIELSLFRSIVDKILPKNYKYVYEFNVDTNKTIPASNLRITQGLTESKTTKFEFWKGDERGELYFDLTDVPQDFKQETDRLLKSQGIYPTRKGEYGFPLYQINSYEGGQLFILTEIDGKPFNNQFFENLFTAYQSTEDFNYLLRGNTAKYKIVGRQGLDRILPNAFSNKAATEIRNGVLGYKSITSEVSLPSLPSSAHILDQSSYIKVDSGIIANRMRGQNYSLNGEKIMVTSTIEEYSVPAGTSKLYVNGKIMTTDQMNLFANKLGFSSFEEMQVDPKMKEWLSPARKTSTMWLVSYTKGKPTAANNAAAIQSPEVKAKVDNTVKWNDVKNLPVYSDKGVMVMRKGNQIEQFGNPFIGSKRQGRTDVVDNKTAFGTIAEASQAYRDWIAGNREWPGNSEISKEDGIKRRAWIIDQIRSGALDGKTFLYYEPKSVEQLNGTMVKGGYFSHADVLANFVNNRDKSKTTGQSANRKKGFTISIDKKGKDQGKASLANHFIGYGKPNTSTFQYEQDAKSQGIPVNYEGVIDENTIAFVSVNGNRVATEDAIESTIENAREVLESGGTVIMDSTADANRSWNVEGEALVQEGLGTPSGKTSKGYNYWGRNPETTAPNTMTLRDGKSYNITQINSKLLGELGYSPSQVGEILKKLC